jgi:hypothetical protein
MAAQTKEISEAVKAFETKFARGEYPDATDILSKSGLTSENLPRAATKAIKAFEKARTGLENPVHIRGDTGIVYCVQPTSEAEANTAKSFKGKTVRLRTDEEVKCGLSGIDVYYDGLSTGKPLLEIIPGECTKNILRDMTRLMRNVEMMGGWMDYDLLVLDSSKLVCSIREGIRDLPAEDTTENNRELMNAAVKEAGPMMDLVVLLKQLLDVAEISEEERPSLWTQLRTSIREMDGLDRWSRLAKTYTRIRVFESLITPRPDCFDGTQFLYSLSKRNENVTELWRSMHDSPLFSGEHLFSKTTTGLERYSKYQHDAARALIDRIDHMNDSVWHKDLRAGVAILLYNEAVAARIASIRLRRRNSKSGE